MPKTSAKPPHITIGSKSLTEQYLLMKMTSLLLRDRGYTVDEMVCLDSPAIRSSMEAGVVDLYWEYTTTARLYYQKKSFIYDPDQLFQAVAEEDKKKGIVWLPRSDFNSSWAILMRSDLSEQLHIYTISDLAKYIREKNPKLKFATNEEYLQREDGMNRLQNVYHFSIPKDQVLTIDSNLLSQAVQESRVEVAVGMASDPRIKEYHLTVLQDDRKVFSPYHAAPVILEKTLKKNPDVEKDLKPLTKLITNQNMLELMYQVDIQHKDVTQTAREFLVEHHLLHS